MIHARHVSTTGELASRLLLYFFSFFCLFVLFPNVAFATPDFGFTPSCNDRSYTDYLAPIFGSLFSCGGSAVGSGGAATGSGSGSAFQAAVGILNAAALTFGGLLAAYTLVAGTMQTSHDGEMLGKRWSSMWLPIRTVLGVGLVVPVAKGYCVAQLVIAFVAGQGIGLADSIWTTYLGKLSSPQGMAPTQRIPEVTDLAKGILTAQVCMQAFNKFQSNSNSSVAAIYPNPMAMITNGNVISFGLPSPGTGNECGNVIYKQYLTATPAQAAANADAANAAFIQSGGMGAVMTSATSQDMSVIDTAHMAAAVQMAATLGTTASNIVNFRDSAGSEPNPASDINGAVIAYQNSVSQTATQASNAQDAMQTFFTNAAKDGWYLAGAWFMKAAAMQDVVNSAISNVPTTTPPSSTLLGDTAVQQAIAPYFSEVDHLVSKNTVTANASSSSDSALSQMSNSDLSQNASGNILHHALARFTQWIGSGIFTAVSINPSRSAIMSIKDIGDYVMTGSEAGMVGGIALISAGGATDKVNASFLGNVVGIFSFGTSSALGGASASAMTTVGYMLIIVGSLFFGLGSLIAVYLPFSPFLIFFGAFIGWLILCAEAILAAPLWAVMHLTPAGDDAMGGARQGYMLILGLVFRPALIVLGFIFSITAVDVIVQGFNGVFFPAFQLAMTGSIMGLGTILVMLCIYFGTMVWLFHTVFGLIHVIPDKLLRWIGGGHESLGESARGISKAGESASGTAARHSDAIRQNYMTGTQSAANNKNAAQSRIDGRDQRAESAQMQEKQSVAKASISDAKADSTGSKMEDKVANVADHMNSANAAEGAVHAQAAQANGGKPLSKEAQAATNKAAIDAREPHEIKAKSRANAIAEDAKKFTEGLDSNATPEAIKEGESKLRAASAAREILGDKEGAAAFETQAATLQQAVKSKEPPKAPGAATEQEE